MSSSHHQHDAKQKKQQQVSNVDFIFKSQYRNTLPDLPSEPKFMQCPFIPLSRFVEYRSTTLEKNYRYELLTEDSSMVKIDLIDPMAYHFNPHEKIPLNPKDERLLEDESISQQNIKRSQQHSKVVPWMRKTEYIGTEFSRFGGDRLKTATKKKTEQEVFYGDRESQIAAIDKTFSDARIPAKKHYSKPGVYAMEETPVLPDVELWKLNFVHSLFDIDPLPYDEGAARESKLQHAIIRGMMDKEGHFVGYFAPNESTLRRLKIDETGEELMEEESEAAFECPLEREYYWTVRTKGPEHQGSKDYFLVLRNGVACYNEIGQKCENVPEREAAARDEEHHTEDSVRRARRERAASYGCAPQPASPSERDPGGRGCGRSRRPGCHGESS